MEPALTAFFGVFIWHNLSTLSKQRDHDDEDDNVKLCKDFRGLKEWSFLVLYWKIGVWSLVLGITKRNGIKKEHLYKVSLHVM